jgi:methylated-DNA-[protein]-cysteine S-methyltransferase
MTRNPALYFDGFDTPLGPMTVTWTERGLHSADFGKASRRQTAACTRAEPSNPYRRAFVAYFEGDLKAFEGLRFDAEGTGFQKRVWDRLLTIPAGETRSYSDIARAVGMPFAVRAVGAANGCNPIAIAVPCHRVIGKDGTLTGYAGGLKRKAWLLRHESALPPPLPGY